MTIRRILLILAAALSAAQIPSFAVPAMPGMRSITLPDGSVVEAELRGDEYFSYYVDANGAPMIERDGFLFYAEAGADGLLKSSGIRAGGSGSMMKAARKIDVAKAYEALNATAVKAKQERRRGPGLLPMMAGFPSIGKQKALVVLVEYSDVSFNLDNPKDFFEKYLNQKGFSQYGADGCVKEYFDVCSNGLFDIQFDLFGPVKLDRERSYYGGNRMFNQDPNAWEMAVDVCKKLDETVDFTQYDRDGDGVIDNIFIYYAGGGEATGGGSETVWPHTGFVSWQMDELPVFDGKKLDRYGCSNEWLDNRPTGIGVFCHEFSHVLGLPDLYATGNAGGSGAGCFTPDSWSALDMGPYNNNGHTPPLYGAFERYALDWIKPRELTRPEDITLRPMVENDACIIKESGAEYFLFENRQQSGYDRFIPGHGMLVWHIYYKNEAWATNSANNDPDMQLVDIEEADAILTKDTRAGDAFPGTAGITSFTQHTNPALRLWKGKGLPYDITDIKETADGLITFKVLGGYREVPAPELMEAEEVTPVAFTARWKSSDLAEGYLLSVFDKETGMPLEGLDSLNVGTSTFRRIEGLDFDHQYSYCVTAYDAYGQQSKSGGEMKVSTLPASLDYLTVNALEPEYAGDGVWNARWERLAEATDYELTAFTVKPGDPYETSLGFDDGVNALPEGWTSNTTQSYANASYAGQGIPSMKMSKDGDCIESAEPADYIRGVSFWQRGVSASEENAIVVSALVGGEWQEAARVKVVNEAPGTVSKIDNLPAGTQKIRIAYEVKGKGSLALDDITIFWGAKESRFYLPDFEARRTGDTDIYPIKITDPTDDVHYVVTALDGELRSLPSQEIVFSPGQNAVDEIAEGNFSVTRRGNEIIVVDRPGVSVSIHDVAGRTVAHGTTATDGIFTMRIEAGGVYILRSGNNRKVLLMPTDI